MISQLDKTMHGSTMVPTSLCRLFPLHCLLARPLSGLPVIVALTGSLILSQLALAQATKAPSKKKKAESVRLMTKDGVMLMCTYYPGPPSKKTVPIILLHDWDGSRGQLAPLALGLQGLKHSVIVPDLRGHVESLYRQTVPGAPGMKIDRQTMKKRDIEGTLLDVEAVKKFLLEKNNKEELNIEQLCVFGTGFGSIVALNWAAMDWEARSLPAYKMGQDVKALILVSPRQSFKGMTTRMALAHPIVRRDLATLIIVGQEDAKACSDARRIHRALERSRSKDATNLELFEPPTSLQGVRLIMARGMNVGRAIAVFIDRQLVKKADMYRWTDRTSPLQ